MTIKSPYDGGGFDWSEKTPTFAQLITASASLVTLVEVAGAGVASTWIASEAAASREANVKITVDGVVLDDETDAALAIRSDEGAMVYGMGDLSTNLIGNWGRIYYTWAKPSVAPNIGFKASLKIEVSTSSGANVVAGAVVHL